jgi:predicted  nucleic acid-binding Zn-ribbon protein
MTIETIEMDVLASSLRQLKENLVDVLDGIEKGDFMTKDVKNHLELVETNLRKLRRKMAA